MNTTLEAHQASAIQPYRMLRGAIVFLGVAVLGSAAALVWVQMRNPTEPLGALVPGTAAATATVLPVPAPAAAAIPVPPAIVINNQTGSERALPVAGARQAATGIRSTESKPPTRQVEPAQPAQPAPVVIAPAPPAPAPAAPAPQVTAQGPAATVPPAVVGAAPMPPAPSAVQAPQPVACANCGIVESVSAIKRNPPTSGTGVVAGGVLGAVVGNQIGKGSGRTLGTILGAIGGGIAGNAVEKQMKKETVYQVRVRMEDGSSRVIEQATAPAIGSRINLDSSSAVETAKQQAPSTSAGGAPVYDASRI